MEMPQKIKNRTTIWPSYSTSGYLTEEHENTNSKRYLHPDVDSSIIYNWQDMEATYVSINRWMDKEAVGCIHKEYYSAIKNNEILPSATWMDLKGIMLSEINQTKKDK